MFGRKKLKKEIKELKKEVAFLNNRPVPISEITRYDVDVIRSVFVMGVEAEYVTKANLNYAKQSLVYSICEKLKGIDNIEDYVEFKQENEKNGFFHMTATIRILRK